jgi:hypothetical protein
MPCPPGLQWLCNPAGTLTHAVGGSVIDAVAASAQHAQVVILTDMLTLWTKIPTTAATSSPVSFLRADTNWLVGFLAVLGLLIAAGHLAWERRVEPARTAAAGLLNLVVVTGASVAVITLGSRAGDAYSSWILSQALSNAGGGSLLAKGQALISLASASPLPSMLLLVLAIFGILACVIQIVLMVVRIAMLGLLAGLLPLGAAISGTRDGRAWFARMLRWLLAYLLYKPVAATIYAYAFVSLTAKSAVDQISGLAVVILAVAALPALMRFLTPMMTAATGSGGGGGAALAAAGAATGARLIPLARGAGTGAAATASGNGRRGPGGAGPVGPGAGAANGPGAGTGAAGLIAAAGPRPTAGPAGSASAPGPGPATGGPAPPGSSGPPGAGGPSGPGGAHGTPAGGEHGWGEGPSGSG